MTPLRASGHYKIIATYLSRKPPFRPVWLVATTSFVLVLVSLLAWPEYAGLDPQLSATRAEVFGRHEWWRVFTAVGVHADLKHLLANFFYFAGLGYLIAGYFGWVAFPLVTFLGGALTHALALATYEPDVRLVGASGMVYLMMAFWLALYFGIERRLSVTRRIVNCIGFSLALLIPEVADARTSYRTHAIGYAVGLMLGTGFYLVNRRKFRRAEKRAVVDEERPFDPHSPKLVAQGEEAEFEDDHWDEGLSYDELDSPPPKTDGKRRKK